MKIVDVFLEITARMGRTDLERQAHSEGRKAGKAMGDGIVAGFDGGAWQRRLDDNARGAGTRAGKAAASSLERAFEKVNLKAPNIDVDKTRALKNIEDVKDKLRALNREEATVKVRMDAAKAMAELVRIEKQVRDLDGRDVRIKVKVDRDRDDLGNISQDVFQVANRLSSSLRLVNFAGLNSAPIVAFGAAVAAATPLVVALASSLGLAAGAASAAIPAFFGLAGGIGSLVGALMGPIKALKAYGTMQDQAAQAGVQFAKKQDAVAKAQDALANAQRQGMRRVEDAQKALTRARKDAAEQIEELSRVSRDAIVDEAEAGISLERAQERLNEVMADAEATDLDRREALLGVTKAQHALSDAQLNSTKAQNEANDAQRRGVDGNEQVIEAQRNLNQTMEDVEQSIRDASIALQDANKELEVGNAATQKFNASMAALSPAGLAFTNTLIGMGDELTQVRHGLEGAVLPGFTQFLNDTSVLIPLVSRFLNDMGGSIGKVAVDIGALSQTWLFRNQLVTILEGNKRAFADMTGAITPMIDAIMTIGASAVPILERFANWVNEVAIRFNNWIEAKRVSGELAAFMKAAGDEAAKWGVIVGNFLAGFVNILIAANPTGRELATNLATISSNFKTWTETNMEEMKDFFQKIKDLDWEKIMATVMAITALVITIKAVAGVVGVINGVMGLLAAGPVGLVLLLILGLAAAFAVLFINSEDFRKKIGELAQKFKDDWIPEIKEWHRWFEEKIQPKLEEFVNELLPRLERAFDKIFKAFKDNEDEIKTVAEFFASFSGGSGQSLGMAIEYLAGQFEFAMFMMGKFVQGVQWAVKYYQDMWNDIKGATNEAKDKIIQFVGDINKWIQDRFNDIERWIQGVKDGFNDWKRNVEDNINGIKTVVSNKWNEIKAVFDGIVSFVTGTFSAMWTNLKGHLDGIWNSIVGFATGAWKRIQDEVFNPMERFLTVTVPGYWETFRTKLEETVGKIAGTVGNLWNDIINTAKTKINELGSLVNKVIDAVNKVPFVNGSIPKLDEPLMKVEGGAIGMRVGGAVFGGPPGIDTVPALGPGRVRYQLNNGEHILTTRDVRAMGGQRGVYEFRKTLHSGMIGMAAGGRVGSQNEGLLSRHRDHLHVAVQGPPMSFPAIIARAIASGKPHGRPTSTYRPGSRGESGGLDHHSTGRAVDFGGENQDAAASWWEGQKDIMELIHRTNTRDYAIFGGSKDGGGGGGLFSWLASAIGKAIKAALDTATKAVEDALPQGDGIAPTVVRGLFKELPKKAIDFFMSKVGSLSQSTAGPGDPAVMRTAYDTAKSMGASNKVLLALFEAGFVESGFKNLGHLGARNDHDSLGFLQQRPSAGWPNPTDVVTATRSFVSRASARQGGHGTAGELAQAVQISAFPDRYNAHRQQAVDELKKFDPAFDPNGFFRGGGIGIADHGGMLMPGRAVLNKSRQPEMVRTKAQEDELANRLEELVREIRNTKTPLIGEVNVANDIDVEEMATRLAFFQGGL